jgi:lipid II:glycine glycyltransferase (peptidoglycan interpeptide bridge formation enzyme)
MIVKEIGEDERPKFFLLAQQLGNIFLDSQWLNALPQGMGLYGIFTKKSGELVGGFCVFRTSKFGIPLLRDAPFSPHVSLFYANKTSNPANYNAFRKKVFSAIADFVNGTKGCFVNISFPPEEKDMQPLLWKGLTVKLRYTYQIDLSKDEKSIYMNFSPERRNDISKALKDGVEAREVTQYDEVEALVLKTFATNKLKNQSHMVKSVLNHFANPNNSLAFVAYHLGKPSSCAFVIHNQAQAYYILGGYDRENRHHGAGALCIWEAIKAIKERKVPIFDFEGSMIPSIESFFRGFGGDLVPFYQVRKYPFL